MHEGYERVSGAGRGVLPPVEAIFRLLQPLGAASEGSSHPSRKRLPPGSWRRLGRTAGSTERPLPADSGGFVLFVSRKGVMGSGDNAPWSLVIGIFGLLTCMASLNVTFNIDNYLTLETRLNSPSFWAKHQDAFAAHAVTAAISAVVGGVVGWLVGHFLK